LEEIILETKNKIQETNAEIKKITGNEDIPEVNPVEPNKAPVQVNKGNIITDPNLLNIKNMGETSVEEAYKREFKSTEEGNFDIYEDINNKNKFNKAYEDDFSDREKTLADDTDDLEKKRTEKMKKKKK